MIFSVADHVEQIVKGTKTQTRRAYTSKYRPGKTYAIQPGRGKLADPRGRILITHAWIESRERDVIHPFDAEAEGGYTPKEYEVLYEKLNPGWGFRWAYEFEFWSTESIESLKTSLREAQSKPSVPWSQRYCPRVEAPVCGRPSKDPVIADCSTCTPTTTYSKGRWTT